MSHFLFNKIPYIKEHDHISDKMRNIRVQKCRCDHPVPLAGDHFIIGKLPHIIHQIAGKCTESKNKNISEKYRMIYERLLLKPKYPSSGNRISDGLFVFRMISLYPDRKVIPYTIKIFNPAGTVSSLLTGS